MSRKHGRDSQGGMMRDIGTWEVGGLRASRIVGVKYRTLDSWVRTGVLPQTATPAQGMGSSRGFALVDLVRARSVAYLRGAGVSMQMIRKVLEELEDRWGATGTHTR